MTNKFKRCDCNGCYRYGIYYKKGNLFCAFISSPPDGIISHVDINDCPCRICLIKMVCRTACPDRHTFWKEASTKHKIRTRESLIG